MSEQQHLEGDDARRAGIVRLAVGLAQGLALWGLIQSSEGQTWPFTDQPLFAALFMVVLFAPAPILASVGRMRLALLLGWSAVAALLLAGFGFYDAWREPTLPTPGRDWEPERAVFAAAALFVGHILVAAAAADGRRLARYETIFATATKFAVQLLLSFAFVGVLWILLFLGASLFEVIGLKAFKEIIDEAWFAAPVSCVAFAAAVHLTDVREGLIRAIRTLGLTLLSWLAPLMTAIAAAFLIALPFTGLEPLWNTGSATAMLLVAAAALAVLINAVYQDGAADEDRPVVLRWSARVAALAMLAIVGVAIYGLSLRIGQHGLSPDRIVAAAIAAVALVLAVGYAFAAVRPGAWMAPVGVTNVAAAFVALALVAALFSPIADPARLSVQSQMARLERGEITPGRFDYAFLRFDGGRWGAEALQRLKQSRNPLIAERAQRALAVDNRYQLESGPNAAPHRLAAAELTVFPNGAALPPELAGAPLAPDTLAAACAAGRRKDCTALLVDLDGTGPDEVVIAAGHAAEFYRQEPTGAWSKAGDFMAACSGWAEGLAQGRATAVAPTWRELDVDGRRLRVSPKEDCVAKASPPAP